MGRGEGTNVDVSTAVELEGGLEGDLGLDVFGRDGCVELFFRLVQAGDVSGPRKMISIITSPSSIPRA